MALRVCSSARVAAARARSARSAAAAAASSSSLSSSSVAGSVSSAPTGSVRPGSAAVAAASAAAAASSAAASSMLSSRTAACAAAASAVSSRVLCASTSGSNAACGVRDFGVLSDSLAHARAKVAEAQERAERREKIQNYRRRQHEAELREAEAAAKAAAAEEENQEGDSADATTAAGSSASSDAKESGSSGDKKGAEEATAEGGGGEEEEEEEEELTPEQRKLLLEQMRLEEEELDRLEEAEAEDAAARAQARRERWDRRLVASVAELYHGFVTAPADPRRAEIDAQFHKRMVEPLRAPIEAQEARVDAIRSEGLKVWEAQMQPAYEMLAHTPAVREGLGKQLLESLFPHTAAQVQAVEKPSESSRAAKAAARVKELAEAEAALRAQQEAGQADAAAVQRAEEARIAAEAEAEAARVAAEAEAETLKAEEEAAEEERARRAASGAVAVREVSEFEKAWSAARGQVADSTAFRRLMGLRDQIEDSDNPLLQSGLERVQGFSGRLGRLWAETDTAVALRELKNQQPEFDVVYFVDHYLKESLIPGLVTALCEEDEEFLEAECDPTLVQQLKGLFEQRQALGWTIASELLDVRFVELHEAAIFDDTPYLTIHFQTHQTNVFKDKDGKVVEGVEGEPVAVTYVGVLRPTPSGRIIFAELVVAAMTDTT